ncbi:3-deoxy-D-arabinoheptulosonate-7-phosphate synthase [Acetoanaerobium noterae]|jgi:3-deoxy-7-phosphoheptulonate synthase|uniref:3-deoxy-D-arabinoheptulosonate-7-phosphate synthase n=2 Tax=Acetoanaerobium TaxID=186831 RepID=A0A1T4ZWN7_9FIRM|nr:MULTISPECIES: 3-deoxy-7-phosphoheptulonate synthase [Acetoanaerobium]MBP8763336.1 3-deoxy-7-phosphoheptulonate synthase [Acetoanaerobium sp.]MDK2803659.1 3-deoxy-7-phosphoheptulonate synthase [Peptostreptococcaceae bacterium]MBP9500055.1 3-deoxy-7-phosphoheptulonate synthase [Acetoanaerobium sp.]MBP9562684.1 3-deoxy-7-phosphoheptulonate synthase [Acetoanaerobium sp.]CBH21877.1 putative chorismate biosynthesis-related protein [includes: phospho-2-dehydro-3-deoxyheptonate aldolase and chorism
MISKILNKVDAPFDENVIDIEKEKLIIAGPCAIESYDQLLETARFIKSKGVKILRGGAYKPRTSPFAFQGMRKEGLEILKAVKKEVGIMAVTEAIDEKSLSEVYEVSDMIQIGSRNMQNFSLLVEAGKQDKPILLKRGMSATIKEWIHAAEYIAKQGNTKIIMCERGIRTFNDYTRNTMDIAAIPIIKQETGLKVIADPSHGTGKRNLILPMSLASLAAGADGLIIEVHPQPEDALSDGDQSLNFEEFSNLISVIKG